MAWRGGCGDAADSSYLLICTGSSDNQYNSNSIYPLQQSLLLCATIAISLRYIYTAIRDVATVQSLHGGYGGCWRWRMLAGVADALLDGGAMRRCADVMRGLMLSIAVGVVTDRYSVILFTVQYHHYRTNIIITVIPLMRN